MLAALAEDKDAMHAPIRPSTRQRRFLSGMRSLLERGLGERDGNGDVEAEEEGQDGGYDKISRLSAADGSERPQGGASLRFTGKAELHPLTPAERLQQHQQRLKNSGVVRGVSYNGHGGGLRHSASSLGKSLSNAGNHRRPSSSVSGSPRSPMPPSPASGGASFLRRSLHHRPQEEEVKQSSPADDDDESHLRADQYKMMAADGLIHIGDGDGDESPGLRELGAAPCSTSPGCGVGAGFGPTSVLDVKDLVAGGSESIHHSAPLLRFNMEASKLASRGLTATGTRAPGGDGGGSGGFGASVSSLSPSSRIASMLRRNHALGSSASARHSFSGGSAASASLGGPPNGDDYRRTFSGRPALGGGESNSQRLIQAVGEGGGSFGGPGSAAEVTGGTSDSKASAAKGDAEPRRRERAQSSSGQRLITPFGEVVTGLVGPSPALSAAFL